MPKITIEERIKNRKYVQPNRIIWNFLSKVVIKGFLEKKYHPTYNIIDDINKEEGPAFVVYNHSSRSDYIYAVMSAYPRRMNFVTGYNEFYRQKFKLIFDLLHQIPKKNFATDLLCMKGMKQIIEQNGVVCFSPEGMSSIVGHNQPVVNGTGKLFKHYNIPVYCLKLHGGYLTNHKVCLDDRCGEMEVEFYKLFSVEDIKNTPAEELDMKLDEALWNDDYEWNKKKRATFKSNGNICSHLHDINFRCPKCGTELEMFAEKDYIKCNHCGNGAHMTEQYDFVPFDDTCVIPESPSKWVDWEREQIIKEIRNNPDYSYTVKCKLGELPKYEYLKNNATSIICGEGDVIVDHTGMSFKGTRNGEPFEFHHDYNILYTLCMSTDVTNFGTYYKGEYLEFFPEVPAVGKVLLTVEEMHRLHVNKWKNFPWMSYMYEDKKEE